MEQDPLLKARKRPPRSEVVPVEWPGDCPCGAAKRLTRKRCDPCHELLQKRIKEQRKEKRKEKRRRLKEAKGAPVPSVSISSEFPDTADYLCLRFFDTQKVCLYSNR